MDKQKYLWLTDTHLKPWTRKKLLNLILDNKSKGVFITGDISHSAPTCINDLEFLGKRAGRKIYFVLGNHDYWLSDMSKVHNDVRSLCQKYKNLVWMTESEVQPINDDVALIGAEGWYDANLGDPNYLKYTLDWRLIKDFSILSSLEERIEKFRSLSKEYTEKLIKSLSSCIDEYKTIYLLTHFPPWQEANRDAGTFMEPFWLPYNVNLTLGKALEEFMQNYKKRNLIVLSGHTHEDSWIHVSRNIECRVNKASYFGAVRNEEHIYI
jgi:predicted phosphohydrolase